MTRDHRRRRRRCIVALGQIMAAIAADPELTGQHAHWSGLGYRLSGRIVRRRGGVLMRIVWANPQAVLSEVRVIAWAAP